MSKSDRRTFLKTTGAASVAATLPFAGTAAADDSPLDDAFDLATWVLQEALVVFDSNDDVDELATLDLVDGYTGDGVHTAVIDSGVDGDHPDLRDQLVHNYQ